MPKTALAVVIAVLGILLMVFWLWWFPLPAATARDAVGTQKAVTIDDRVVAYYIRGEGPPVVLLASAGREASDFNELVIHLNNAGYRTIAVEAHGINRSSLPEEKFSLFDIAQDVARVVDAEVAGNETLTVIGHAFGNRVARAFASQNDSRVNGVVLIASGGRRAIPAKAGAALRAIFDPRRRFAQRQADIDFAFFARGNRIPEYWTRGWHTKTAIFQGAASLQAYEDWGAGGTKPMLVLQAAEDRIAPPQDAGLPLARAYPGRVKLVVVKGAGHAFLPEQPAAVAAQITSFLSTL